MAIFTAIATAIVGATLLTGIAATVATAVLSSALAFGASLAYSYLTRKKTRTYSATAVQGELQIGGDIPIGVAFGTIKTKGQRIYYAKYGSGNQYNADVFVLSNGWCDGLENYVFFYGQKWTLTSITATGGCDEAWTISGWEGLLEIRFFSGKPTQAVDSTLVSATSALGQEWKSTSTLKGVCYVTVIRKYDSSKWDKGRPDFDFVLRGLRCYDWRLDDTVSGGSGDHRINDSTTWEFTKNPAVQRFNYQIGLKGISSNRILIGEGKQFSELSISLYTASANIADTDRTKGARTFDTYQCNLYVMSTDAHSEVLREFDDAMAGYAMNPGGLAGVLAGAAQTPVMTIDDDDIRNGEPISIRRRRPGSEGYNHLSGQFMSIDADWTPAALTPIVVAADVTADKYIRTATNDFLQVTDQDVAQYLLNIRYRQNRLGGSVTLPVSRRVAFQLNVGDWVTYAGLTWMIAEQMWEGRLQCTLRLAEVSSDTYSETGIVSGPVIVPPSAPVNPSLLSNVANFTVASGYIEGSAGKQVPALQFGWDAPDDPSITQVVIQYRKNGTTSPVYITQSADPESGSHFTTDSIVPGILYDARCTIITDPDRLKTYSSWISTVAITPDWAGVVAALAAEQEANLVQIREDIDSLKINVPIGFAEAKLITALEASIRQTMKVKDGENEAAVITEQLARADADGSLAQILSLVTARTDGAAAEGLFKIQAIAAPTGVDVRLALYGRIDAEGGAYEEAGLFIDLTDEGGGVISSKIVLMADTTSIQNNDGDVIAVFDADGIILNSLIPLLTADNIAANTITANEIAINGLTGNASKFVTAGLSQSITGYAAPAAMDDMNVDIEVANPDVKVLLNFNGTFAGTTYGASVYFYIDGNEYPYAVSMDGGGGTGDEHQFQISHQIIWEPIDTITFATAGTGGVSRLWKEMAWSEDLGIFVAVGNTASSSSNAMSSTNGTSWTSRTTPTNQLYNGVCWGSGAGVFVAVGASGAVMTSSNGTSWTSRTGSNGGNNAVCWSESEGLFVAVGATGSGTRVQTSPDGITWTTRTSAANNSWQDVVYSPSLDLFVAVSSDGASGRVMTSPDGITWTLRTDANALAGSWYSIDWSPELGIFVACGNETDSSFDGPLFMYSDDGINWTHSGLWVLNNRFISVRWSPELGMFLALCTNNNFTHDHCFAQSFDGIEWRVVAGPGSQYDALAWAPSLGVFSFVEEGSTDVGITDTVLPVIGDHTIEIRFQTDINTVQVSQRALTVLQFLR